MRKEPKRTNCTKRLGKYNGRHVRFILRKEREREVSRILHELDQEEKKGMDA